MLPKHALPRHSPGPVPYCSSLVTATPAAVAHDLKNLLGVMQGTLTLMAEDTAEGSAAAKDVGELSVLVERAIGLTRQLTAPSTSALPVTDVSARDVLTVVARFARRLVPRDVRLETDSVIDLPVIAVDRYRLEQALLNLIVNAVEAVSAGGTIRISARPGVSGSPCARTPHVVFSVSDDGHGIPERLQARVLEPYFSTKPPAIGTGLGLPCVNETARAFGGWVEIESGQGHGTTVRLCLPAAATVIN